MKTGKTSILVMAALVAFVWCTPAEAFPWFDELLTDETIQDVSRLKHDIEILNLLNALYLTQQQLDDLLDIHQRSETLFEDVKMALSARADESKRSFAGLRHALITGRDPEQPLAHQAQQENHRLKEIGVEALDDFTAIAVEVEDLLNESQKVIVSHYISCLIPPKNEVNPLRVGQSGNSDGPKHHLGKIREIPTVIYLFKKNEIVDKIHSHISTVARGIPGVSLEDARERIIDLLDEIRAMSETEFRLYDKDPIKEIIGHPPILQASEDLKPKINRFLLHPRVKPLLEEIKRHRQACAGTW